MVILDKVNLQTESNAICLNILFKLLLFVFVLIYVPAILNRPYNNTYIDSMA